MSFKLFQFQEQNVDSIRERFRAGDSAVLYQLSTGGGKTYTFCYIAENAAKRGNRVWILVHRKELIRQTSKSLRTLGVHHGIVAPGFTPDPLAQIQVCSVQTLVNRLGKLLPPDLIIVDECHHTVAATYMKILDFYKLARILGVTATPCRLDGRGLGRTSGGYYDSMVNGPPLSELIRMGRLCMPRMYAPPVGANVDNLPKRYGDFVKGAADEEMQKPKIIGNAVEHYRKILQGAPSIAFCTSVATAERTAEEFRAAGYNAASVDGNLDDRERDRRINALGNGGLHVLTSCDIVSEGTDIPAVVGAILLRPSASLSMVMQQIGRCLREMKGKEFAYVLDHVKNLERHELQGMGYPEFDIEWSLEGEVKKKKKKGETGPGFRQCPACWSVHPPGPICTVCGFEYGCNARELEQVDGELEEVDPALDLLKKREAERSRWDRVKEEAACNSYADFVALAEKRGYNKAWAGMRWGQKKQKMAARQTLPLPGV